MATRGTFRAGRGGSPLDTASSRSTGRRDTSPSGLSRPDRSAPLVDVVGAVEPDQSTSGGCFRGPATARLRIPATLARMAEWMATGATALVGLVGVTALLWTARQERAASLANLRQAAEVERHRLDLI